jgi:hypothetical protein
MQQHGDWFAVVGINRLDCVARLILQLHCRRIYWNRTTWQILGQEKIMLLYFSNSLYYKEDHEYTIRCVRRP